MERFANISETELEEIIDQKDAPNTKKATTFARNILMTYCNSKNLDFTQISATIQVFNDFLRKFYVEIRKLGYRIKQLSDS